MINYYRSEPDPFWDKLKEANNNHAEFFDDCREYLLEQHGCNFSQFIEICTPPYDSIDFWEEMAETEDDPKRVIDDIFQNEQAERQQRFINNVVVGSN